MKFLRYVVVSLGAFLVVAVLPKLVLHSASFVEPVIEELNGIQRAHLDMFLEMNRTIISLATLILAAAGTMLLHFHKTRDLDRVELKLAALTAAAAGLSISFGYISFETTSWMLQSSFFNLDNPVVAWPQSGQYTAFVLAAVFLGALLFRSFWKRIGI